MSIGYKAGSIIYYLGYGIWAYFLLSYSYTTLRNPGVIMRSSAMFDELFIEKIKEDKKQYCKICNVVKKPHSKIEHCYDCNLCIEGTSITQSLITIAHGWGNA
jgi:hypothetical protein